MSDFESVQDYYTYVKSLLEQEEFKVNPFRAIQHGIQFIVFFGPSSGIIRVYDGKKGIRPDLSQVKDDVLRNRVEAIFSKDEKAWRGKVVQFEKSKSYYNSMHNKMTDTEAPTEDPDHLIGVDESGKGDYFGPLVVAGVYTDPEKAEELIKLGVMDSKVLTDKRIRSLAKTIKKLCPHALAIMGNSSYNYTYLRMENLNHILAWGHAKVLERTLEQVDCKHALCDQFGHESLILSHLVNKAKDLKVYQRPRAEDNISVAAASILARDAFVTHIEKMEKQYKMTFPKGCSVKTYQAAEDFCEKFGYDELDKVAKLHFSLTKRLIAEAKEKYKDL